MNLVTTFTRIEIKDKFFPNWDMQRAFIFRDNELIGIVYNQEHNLNTNAPLKFCVCGELNGDYASVFNNNPIAPKPIHIFKSLGEWNVEFLGLFEVNYIGTPTTNNSCLPSSNNGVLVGEIY